MTTLGKKGATLLEALIAFIILSLVFSASLTIIVNSKKQTQITQERINAVNVASMVRDKIESEYTYDDLAALIATTDVTVTNSNCNDSGITGICDVFNETIGDVVYDDLITLVFLQANTTSQTYQIVHFTLEVVYWEELSVKIEGVIYE
jgi:competence protein ComGC